jgi:hypothetical protein
MVWSDASSYGYEHQQLRVQSTSSWGGRTAVHGPSTLRNATAGNNRPSREFADRVT